MKFIQRNIEKNTFIGNFIAKLTHQPNQKRPNKGTKLDYKLTKCVINGKNKTVYEGIITI